ncbi:zinc-ribbon domain containing protein [Caldicellulosiruptoraceae bacterium PP1]
MYQDKVLVCKDCGREFVFTAGEQEFYAEKGFKNEPSRCKDCRDQRKSMQRREARPQQKRELFDAVCSACGKETKVPFRPRNDRPIYCSDCFAKVKATN